MSKKQPLIKPFDKYWWTIIMMIIFTTFIVSKLVINPKAFLITLATITIIYLFIYKYLLIYTGKGLFFIANELPLYLCSLNIIFGLIGVIYNLRTLLAFCISIGLAGAILALLMPEEHFINIPIFSLRSIGFYGYHSLLIIFDLSLVTLKYYLPTYKDAISLTIFSALCLLVMHVINIILRKTNIHPQANYCYTMFPINSALEFFYNIVSVKCLYLYLIIPLFVLLFLLESFIIKILL